MVAALTAGTLSARADAEFVNSLIGKMTLEEKVGQLIQVGSEGAASSDESKKAITPELAAALRAGRVGSLIGACGPKKFNDLQRIAVKESRLGIPIMVGHDVIHGCRTVLPIPLGLSTCWDEEVWRKGGEMMAVEALTRGCNWTFNPMLDISRDARWGRIAESPGQDPLVASRYAAAIVRGYQGDDPSDGRHIAACLKHFVAYGAGEGGRDYNTVELSDDTLRNVYLPPFRAAVQAGALTVMPAFHALNGVPCSVNRYLLTDVLRGEFGFRGFTISDWGAVAECATGHAVGTVGADIAAQAINAGMVQEMVTDSFKTGLAEAVRDGRVTEATLDEAVRRVLTVKEKLGLFRKPYLDENLIESVDFVAHNALARETAAKCCVLLKNGPLPLAKDAKVALVGTLANDPGEMLGTWQTWRDTFDRATLREGLEADGVTVSYAPCFAPTGKVDVAALRRAVADADVVVAAFGELCSMNGENCSRADITLPGDQLTAIREIKASGKPFVAVLFSGRPLAIPELAESADALISAWNPGSSGGWGVADVLTGKTEPYGRLTVDFPTKTGECPLYYNRLPTGRPWEPNKYWVTRYIDAPSPGRSLYPFGFGLTYTSFSYSNEQVKRTGDKVVCKATIANTGARAGSELVQVYVRDLVAPVSRPRRELKGYARVSLKPGERSAVTIEIPVAELGFWHDGKRLDASGEFAAWIAPDSDSGKELRFMVD